MESKMAGGEGNNIWVILKERLFSRLLMLIQGIVFDSWGCCRVDFDAPQGIAASSLC